MRGRRLSSAECRSLCRPAILPRKCLGAPWLHPSSLCHPSHCLAAWRTAPVDQAVWKLRGECHSKRVRLLPPDHLRRLAPGRLQQGSHTPAYERFPAPPKPGREADSRATTLCGKLADPAPAKKPSRGLCRSMLPPSSDKESLSRTPAPRPLHAIFPAATASCRPAIDPDEPADPPTKRSTPLLPRAG